MPFPVPLLKPLKSIFSPGGIAPVKRTLAVLLLSLAFPGCAASGSSQGFHTSGATGSPSSSFNSQTVATEAEEDPGEPGSIPYRVGGKIYYPLDSGEGYDRTGIASWYGPKFHGKQTSNQEAYNMHSMTAAHKTLPFNTRVRVTNLSNGRSVIVRINDRGPFVGNRIIDLSYQAGVRLGMVKTGTVPVRVQALESVHSSAGQERFPVNHAPKAYTVQVGVFKKRENAERMARELEDGEVLQYSPSGETLYRVVTTAYNTFDEAQARMDRLRSEGRRGAFVIAAPAP